MTIAKVHLAKEMGSISEPGFHCVVFYRNDLVLIKTANRRDLKLRWEMPGNPQ